MNPPLNPTNLIRNTLYIFALNALPTLILQCYTLPTDTHTHTHTHLQDEL